MVWLRRTPRGSRKLRRFIGVDTGRSLRTKGGSVDFGWTHWSVFSFRGPWSDQGESFREL